MKRVLLLLACLLNIAWASAQFSGSGSGTSSDPYRIFNADQLTQLRNFLNQEGVYFKLQNDIDISEWLSDNYPGQGWQPVGSTSEPFKGTLDGNGKTISGFSITRSTTDYVGLFAYVNNASIKNLTLKGDISGKGYVGSLVGCGSAVISNYTFEGTVTGTGDYVGGASGNAYTTSTNITVKAIVKGANYTGGIFGKGPSLSSSTFTGEVTGSKYTGGLMGSGNGTFSSCIVNAPVTGGDYTGGLLGSTPYNSSISISNSSHNGIVAGGNYTGGLIGYSWSASLLEGRNITHTGNISGKMYTGGFLGTIEPSSTNSEYATRMNLTSCFIECDITGTNFVGGLCGSVKNLNTSTISGCHFWGNITGTSDIGGIIGNISTNYTDEGDVNYKNFIVPGNRADYDGVPVVEADCFFNSKTQNYYKYYPQKAYLNGTDAILTDNEIGKWKHSEGTITYYSAGNLRTITVPTSLKEFILENDDKYRLINIQDCSVVGNISGSTNNVGGILGSDITENGSNRIRLISEIKTVYYYALGDTENYCSPDLVYSYAYTYSATNIKESYFSGTIKGANYVGGIAGTKETGSISNCYSLANISGKQYVGGIAGSLTRNNNYNKCENVLSSNVCACTAITGTSNVGRIYGKTDGKFTIAELGTTSENRSMASTLMTINGSTQIITDNLQNGTAVGISQLRLKANYVAWGWDFNSYWTIQETESFPYKTWQAAPPTLAGKLYSGATTISGSSVDGGTVHLTTSSGKSYTATCSGNSWTVNVTALHAGEEVTMYVETPSKEKSYISTATVKFKGSGTEDDPYQITSAEDLQGMNTGGYYKIMNNINLTSWIKTYSSSKGWVPIGYDGAAVYIDGDGHTITGLWTNTTDTYVGLFSKLEGGYIKNLNVQVASGKKVIGGTYTGIIIGRADNFKIFDCTASGNVKGTTNVGGLIGYFVGSSSTSNLYDVTYSGSLSSTTSNANIGGIVGYASCYMTRAESTAQITSTGSTSHVGGLVGKISGNVSQSYANATITASGTSSNVGGLIGGGDAVISQSYTEGNVTATGSSSFTGGIAGQVDINQSGSITDCYSAATVSGTQYTAGIVGKVSKGAVINRCYASGNVSGIYFGAGIVGYLYGTNAKAKNCVALSNILSFTDQTAWASRVIGGYDNAAGDPDGSNLALSTMQVSLNNVPVKKYDDLVEGIATTEAALKQAATYESKGWDFSDVWSIKEGTAYPTLKWATPVSVTSIALNQTTLTLNQAGQTATISATVLPEDAADKSVTWTSSNTSVTTVSSAGVVTAVANGTATITATTKDGTNLSATCEVTVNIPADGTTGDVNGDGDVNVGDIIGIINVITGSAEVTSAADVNGDGDVNVGDIIGVINIITGNTTSNVKQFMPADIVNTDYISYADVNGIVDLKLNNEFEYSAFQMTVSLLENQTLASVNFDSSRTDGFNTVVKEVGNGKYIIIGYSMDGKVIEGTSGTMLTLKLSNGNSKGLCISDAIFATPNTRAYQLNVINGNATGIDNVKSLKMWVEGNIVYISNPETADINVYSLNGSLVKRMTANKGLNTFMLPNGTYIINKQKIVIR